MALGRPAATLPPMIGRSCAMASLSGSLGALSVRRDTVPVLGSWKLEVVQFFGLFSCLDSRTEAASPPRRLKPFSTSTVPHGHRRLVVGSPQVSACMAYPKPPRVKSLRAEEGRLRAQTVIRDGQDLYFSSPTEYGVPYL